MNAAEYHAHPAIGSTALRALIRSAEHYHAEYVACTAPRAETPAMRRGTAVLEPEKWATRYAVAPECDRRTKAGKEARIDLAVDYTTRRSA